MAATRSTARNRPRLSPRARGAARCDACHVDGAGIGWMPDDAQSQPPRVALARPNLKFNHRLHATRGIGCESCHASAATQAMVDARRSADDGELPRLSRRQARGNQATARCGACHLTVPDGRLQVQLATAATIMAGGTGLLEPSGSLRGLRRARSDLPPRPRAGRARRELLPDLPSPQRVRRLPRRGRAAPRHPPLGLRLAARAGRAPQHPRLLLLPPAADLLHRVPPADGRGVRPDGWSTRGQGHEPVRDRHRRQAVPPAGLGARRRRCGHRCPTAAESLRPGQAKHPRRAFPATARRAASPATQPTRRGGRTSRRMVPISAGRPAAGSWPPATSAPASSVTPSVRLSWTANDPANNPEDPLNSWSQRGPHYT